MKDEYIYGAGSTWTARTAMRKNPIAPDQGAMMLGEYLERGSAGITAARTAASATPQASTPAEPLAVQLLKKAALVGGVALLFAAAKMAYESQREPDER